MRAGSFTALAFVVALATTAPLHSSAQAQSDESTPNPYGRVSAQPPDERLSMRVNLHTQWAYVYRGDNQIASTPISSGRRHYRTPTGTFTVLEKQKTYHSKRYHHAPMPYMQRLTSDGVALHAGSVPRHPSSHGCVHLPTHFAQWLYNQPTVGMKVVITDEPSAPKPDLSGSMVASADANSGETNSAE
ncbi:MAG TPA: L,D-transpeptidase family protein [Rhizomicrobium sp.]